MGTNSIKSIYFRNDNLLSLEKYNFISTQLSIHDCVKIGDVNKYGYSEHYYIQSSEILISQHNSTILHFIQV